MALSSDYYESFDAKGSVCHFVVRDYSSLDLCSLFYHLKKIKISFRKVTGAD